MSGQEFNYLLFGLRLKSEIALPGLVEDEPNGVADVRIRRGSVIEPTAEPGYVIRGGGTLLTIPDVGRYFIREGKEILAEAEPGASERNLRLFLLGSALGALLHQRGMLPLHANAIDLAGRVVAFSGHSGAGKSTIAAWFHDRGHRVLSDDVCVVAFEAGRPVAYPGLPRLRLRPEALAASGRAIEDYDPSFDDLSKYDVPTRFRSEGPLPLDRVYLLGKAPDSASETIIRRLRGVDAVDALVSNTYRGSYLRSIGRTQEHLMACARLAGEVPVFSAERVWGLDAFQEQAELLERHAALPVAAADP